MNICGSITIIGTSKDTNVPYYSYQNAHINHLIVTYDFGNKRLHKDLFDCQYCEIRYLITILIPKSIFEASLDTIFSWNSRQNRTKL